MKKCVKYQKQHLNNSIYIYFKKNIIKFDFLSQNLLIEYKKKEILCLENQTENESLQRKNQLLNLELNENKKNIEILTENYMRLSKFESAMKLVSEKFPNFTIEKLIDKLEYLEKAGMDFTKKLGELEDDKLTIEREKQVLILKINQ